ncbi:uncharacterized protein BDR25DRAFT_8237 [Lindgomyces ingoldianus]|uniref:Uncharacterized protein n=1 Tax=Lindgomyces ingoldianus TaxID=673940 RepID=A0ACB6RG83_9PLEO|nr:uncharacterized protein BDR25DRAFT_8237 [Lindgomyces ingoldianus]KAF2478121.1 hypothetical protein BDR25DRAFT_8237 [Lindgomyces ingoldianus]
MEGGDPDAPTQKRPRLDSVNPVYNGLPPPQPARHPTGQASSPPPSARHYPTHSLPPPSQPYPPQGHYQGPSPSPSLPSTDIRAYSDPRSIPSPGQRTHGVTGPPVTLPARTISQDNIATYRPPVTPQSTAPDHPSSRSTSGEAKLPPGMDHGGHQTPWPVNPEHRHNGSIPNVPNGLPNGYPVVSPQHEQPYQTPLPQAQHFAQPVAYSQGPYMSGPASQYQQAHMRRKQVRATQACNNCRSRKQKCDEQRPCQFCKDNQYECQYKDVPPPKQDRTMMQLQDSVNSVSDMLKTFVEGFNSWKDTVESRLPPVRPGDNMTNTSNHPSPEQMQGIRGSFSEHSGSRMPTPVQGRAHLRRVNSMKIESPVTLNSMTSPIPAQGSTPIKQESILAGPQAPATPAESIRADHTNLSGEDSLRPGEKAGLLGDHTTPAHQVLEGWPSMQTFCNDIPYMKWLLDNGHKISDYPMELEKRRGLIRVWGVGEGHDLNDGAQGPGSPDSNESDAPSPAAAREGLWGTGEASSPGTASGSTPREIDGSVGGLDSHGNLKLDSVTLFELHKLYHDYMHNMHPFLNPSKLRKMVKEFGEAYSPDSRSAHAFSPGSAIPSHVAGQKRKRSSFDTFSPGRERPGQDPIERSLRNAIVLLVLALGKVCQYQQPLPAPQCDKGMDIPDLFSRGSPHSSGASFNVDDGQDNRPRNIDILPGMAYFSYATDILGNQQGGNTVAHAQAMLLAALYLGQFARVMESWSWINNACRVCLILIKDDMPRIDRESVLNQGREPPFPPHEQYRLNLVKCVYWTCLQLESDILAELSNLPPSDISKYSGKISYPSGVYEKFPETISYSDSSEHERVMWIYSSQIHLRVILNEAHNGLYGADGKRKRLDNNNLKEVATAAKVHSDILLSWRKVLPAELVWDDNDPPSTDLNIARLRAKFYGGHYMILRHFLYMATHEIELPPGPPMSQTSAWSSQHSSPAAVIDHRATPTTMHRTLMDFTHDQSEILDAAFQCIRSAIQSTIAFDRVGALPEEPYERYKDTAKHRLILTNIFGTLHAQFGNMIVLAAVFKSRLRYHLPNDNPKDHNLTKSTLSKLLNRTIKVLGTVAPNSPVLKMDAQILQNIQRLLNLENTDLN